MAGTRDRRKAAKARAAKLDAEQKLSLDQLEQTMEAKEILARAFLGAGGLEALIDWIKQNGDNRGMFYSHYAKLIQQSVVTQVKATVEVGADKQLAAAMVDALCRIQKARESGIDAKGVIIDKTVTIEHQPKTEEPESNQAPQIVINKAPPEP